MSFSGLKRFRDTVASEEPEFASLSSSNISQKREAVLLVEKADLLK